LVEHARADTKVSARCAAVFNKRPARIQVGLVLVAARLHVGQVDSSALKNIQPGDLPQGNSQASAENCFSFRPEALFGPCRAERQASSSAVRLSKKRDPCEAVFGPQRLR